MKIYSISEYARAGCPFLKDSPPIFIGLHKQVGGKVCDTGCGQFDGGRCAAYAQMVREVKINAGQNPSETVRLMGHRLDISISEVRRRRQGWKARDTCGPCMCAAHMRQRKEEAEARA
jgi:hypothetical protein